MFKVLCILETVYVSSSMLSTFYLTFSIFQDIRVEYMDIPLHEKTSEATVYRQFAILLDRLLARLHIEMAICKNNRY